MTVINLWHRTFMHITKNHWNQYQFWSPLFMTDVAKHSFSLTDHGSVGPMTSSLCSADVGDGNGGGQWTGHDTCLIQLNNACGGLSCMFNWLPRAWYRQAREIVNLSEFGFMCMPPQLPTMPAAHRGRVQRAIKACRVCSWWRAGVTTADNRAVNSS